MLRCSDAYLTEPESPNTNYCNLSNPSSVKDDKSAHVSSALADDDDHHPIPEKDPLENGEKTNARNRWRNCKVFLKQRSFEKVEEINQEIHYLLIDPEKKINDGGTGNSPLHLALRCNVTNSPARDAFQVRGREEQENGRQRARCQERGTSRLQQRRRLLEEEAKLERVRVLREGDLVVGMRGALLPETSFRQKFLTWYSLRASDEEMRVARVFIDTFTEDPESLAGQLLDTFSDVVLSRASASAAAGLCIKLNPKP
ncbi:hypothetical protein M569_12041 [Genlisea aurea]|uniref:VIN3-like C-terminal domain-containing protein n=1 Tax=Genlisea aurea TaxID=192259 RepID=S8DIQ8_9LAMI|nr:hypothetical protein M569_12041 [Genlisea aurea]